MGLGGKAEERAGPAEPERLQEELEQDEKRLDR